MEVEKPLAGRVVLLAGDLRNIGGCVASALADLGATVGAIGVETADDRVQPVDGPTGTRSEAIETFAAAAALLGPLDGVVYVPGVSPSLEDRLLVDTDEEAWDRGAEAPMRAALAVLQAGYAELRGRGGTIVALVPSIALTGAAGLVPFAAAAEGIRLMVKSAARAWGTDNVRVNCVTLPIDQWGIEQPDGHLVPNRFGPSLQVSDTPAEAAGAIALLVSDLARGITGATIGVDHGTVLAP